MSTTPPATAEYMKPLIGSADPQVNTWLTDFSSAITYAVQNYINALTITYTGSATTGTTVSPVAGIGRCITPFIYTPLELKGQCVGEDTIVNIFDSISTKLSGCVWTWVDPSLLPIKLFTPWTFNMSCFFKQFGLACKYDLKSTITNLQENMKVSDTINFYNIFDKHLSNALKTIVFIPTTPMTGAHALGAYTGASMVTGTSVHVQEPISSKNAEDVKPPSDKDKKDK